MGIFDRLRRRLGPDRLAAEVRAALRAAGATDVRYDRATFAIDYRGPGGQSARMYLQNLYAECEQDPQNRAERILWFVTTFATLSDVPDEWEAARPLLRPVLRQATFARANPGQGALRRPVLPYLDEMVVVDQPTSMAYVVDPIRGRWGVSVEEVFAAARANLAARSGADGGAGLPEPPSVLRFVDDGDAYWVSHLVVDGWLAGLAGHVGARPVAFVPDAATLLVVPDEPDQLSRVFEVVREEFLEAPRALSPAAYTVDGAGRIVPYAAPGHPLQGTMVRAERTLAAFVYATQQETLRGRGLKEVVADCGLYADASGAAFTVTTWEQGAPALLPRTDYVCFAPTVGAPFYVPWPAVSEVDVVAEALEHRPARYHADAWPSAAALGYLRERAVELSLGQARPR